MPTETVPPEPMPPALRAMLARNAWQEAGTGASVQAWYAARELYHRLNDHPAAADMVDRAWAAEADDPEPLPEGWTR